MLGDLLNHLHRDSQQTIMHRSFRQTHHSKLFCIGMGLIFPVCLIYREITEILFKEILMKKEEEEEEFTLTRGWIVAFMTQPCPGGWCDSAGGELKRLHFRQAQSSLGLLHA